MYMEIAEDTCGHVTDLCYRQGKNQLCVMIAPQNCMTDQVAQRKENIKKYIQKNEL